MDLQGAILKPSSVEVLEDGLYELVVVFQILHRQSALREIPVNKLPELT